MHIRPAPKVGPPRLVLLAVRLPGAADAVAPEADVDAVRGLLRHERPHELVRIRALHGLCRKRKRGLGQSVAADLVGRHSIHLQTAQDPSERSVYQRVAHRLWQRLPELLLLQRRGHHGAVVSVVDDGAGVEVWVAKWRVSQRRQHNVRGPVAHPCGPSARAVDQRILRPPRLKRGRHREAAP